MNCPKTLSGIHSPDLEHIGYPCRYCGAAPGEAELARVKAEIARLSAAADEWSDGEQSAIAL